MEATEAKRLGYVTHPGSSVLFTVLITNSFGACGHCQCAGPASRNSSFLAMKFHCDSRFQQLWYIFC